MLKKILSFTLCIAMLTSVFIPSLSVFAENETVQIPDDAVEYNGHYYKAYVDRISWFDAKSACESMGGHLATITDANEDVFVFELSKTTGYTCWIGGTDEKQEGVWKWITGEPWEYENSWFDNCGGVQHYLVINYEPDGRWDDQSAYPGVNTCCVNGYICEWESFSENEYDSIKIGDCITLGRYNGKDIVWRCVLIDENGPLMLSEDSLCDKEYDAPGVDSTYHKDGWGDTIRSKYGSNCWQDSNIRQWLNAAGKVEYTHCPPSYKDEIGFLSNFTSRELIMVKAVRHKVTLISYDAGRSGYCDGGSSDRFDPMAKEFNINNYYHKVLEDQFMLLDATQIHNIYYSNPEFLKYPERYYTACIGGNDFACFENTRSFDPNATTFTSYGANELYGIRPAFYLNTYEYKYQSKINKYESLEQYMASVIVNKGYDGILKNHSGVTAQNEIYNYWLDSDMMSLSRIIVSKLNKDKDFVSSVAAWKTANLIFEPGSEVIKGSINSIDYYTAIILAVLDCAIIDTFVSDSMDSIKNTTSIITTAIFENLHLDANKNLNDLLAQEWPMFTEQQHHDAIQSAYGRCYNLKTKNTIPEDIFKLYEISTNIGDFVNKIVALEEAAKLDNSVLATLKILDDSCSATLHPEMKAAITEVKNVCGSNFEKIWTEIVDGVALGSSVVLSDAVDNMWQGVLATAGSGFGTGAVIGYAVGKSISNFCFSTDKIIERYYVMSAMAEFEDLMTTSANKAESAFLWDKTKENATIFLTVLKMLSNTYKLSSDYAKEYYEVIYTEGLVRGIQPLFGFGKEQKYEEVVNTCNNIKSSIQYWEKILFDFDYMYIKGLEEDDYSLYMDYQCNGISKDKFWNLKNMTVACPTDVDVYCGDEHVLSIVSDKVVGLKPGICVYVKDSVKYILLPDDMDFSVKIKGTDSGTMDYTVTEYTDSGEKKVTAFEDVPLTDGCTYDTVVDSVNEERYILTDENGQTVEPDFVSDDFVFSSEAPTLPLENNTSNDAVISVAGEMACYTFTPSVSGNYVFYSTASDNAGVIGYVYDENLNKLREDIPNIDDNNFYININLTAGNQYIFVIRYYDSSMSGTVPFNFGNVFTIDYYYYGSQTFMSLGKKCYGIDTTLDRTVLERDGYTFLGWSTNSTATAVEYYPGGTFSIDADTTLYAVWKENDPSVRITLDPNSNYTVNSATGTVIAKMSAKNGEGLTEFMSNITTDSERIQITNAFGAVQTNVSRLTTGHEVQILGDDGNILKSYTIIILGDTDSNGRLSISDVSGVKTASTAKPEKGTVEFMEANVDGNSRLSIADASALQTFLATGEW